MSSTIQGQKKQYWLSTIWQRARTWFRDPFDIAAKLDQDWEDFRGMSACELCAELDLLIDTNPLGNRLRRLCHFLALEWYRERLVEKTYRPRSVFNGSKSASASGLPEAKVAPPSSSQAENKGK